jgi:hypothetical protein
MSEAERQPPPSTASGAIPVSAKELIFDVYFSLLQNRRFLMRNVQESDMRMLAAKIVDHLSLCRVEFVRQPPGPWHSTPPRVHGGE